VDAHGLALGIDAPLSRALRPLNRRDGGPLRFDREHEQPAERLPRADRRLVERPVRPRANPRGWPARLVPLVACSRSRGRHCSACSARASAGACSRPATGPCSLQTTPTASLSGRASSPRSMPPTRHIRLPELRLALKTIVRLKKKSGILMNGRPCTTAPGVRKHWPPDRAGNGRAARALRRARLNIRRLHGMCRWFALGLAPRT
jgi:hypothetical protein